MKTPNCMACILTLLFVVSPDQLYAQEDRADSPLMISRGADGLINKESKMAVRQLSRMANQNGHVSVWVTLNYPYDPFLVNLSEQAAADQDANVRKVFDEILAPLIAKRLANHFNGEPTYSGPSLRLSLTASGLRRLIRDSRVGQIVGIRKQ